MVTLQKGERVRWLFHCHVNDHIAAGMLTRYKVNG